MSALTEVLVCFILLAVTAKSGPNSLTVEAAVLYLKLPLQVEFKAEHWYG